jgi:hypothetical protein
MRALIYTVAVPVLSIFAFAQDTPPVQQPTGSAPSTAAKSSQAPSDKTAGQTASTTSSLPEMKTQIYSGTLMDVSCAGSGSAPAATSSTSSTASSTSTSSSADRSTGSNASQSCGVSTSTTQFALKMKDGNTVKFDDVGNARVQEAMKTRKKWSESASASKPIRVKASGVLNSDTLTVVSVN